MITTSENGAPCISPPSRGLTDKGRLSILQISTNGIGGGAEKVAWGLFRGYRERGYRSWLAVGTKRGDDPDILQILTGDWRFLWRVIIKPQIFIFIQPGPIRSQTQFLKRSPATPVAATAVGGIPEQVKSLQLLDHRSSVEPATEYDPHEATGMLVAPGNPEVMALSIERILGNDTLRRRLGENAAKDAEARFDVKREIND